MKEAFLAHKQDFISRCKERQKRLALASEYRQMQECMRLEREAIFMDQDRVMPANLDTHPYSGKLYEFFFFSATWKELGFFLNVI